MRGLGPKHRALRDRRRAEAKRVIEANLSPRGGPCEEASVQHYMRLTQSRRPLVLLVLLELIAEGKARQGRGLVRGKETKMYRRNDV